MSLPDHRRKPKGGLIGKVGRLALGRRAKQRLKRKVTPLEMRFVSHLRARRMSPAVILGLLAQEGQIDLQSQHAQKMAANGQRMAKKIGKRRPVRSTKRSKRSTVA